MAVTNSYATLAEFRDHLGDAGSTLDESQIERSLDAASRAIDRFTRRRFWRDTGVTTRVYRVRNPHLAWVDDISTTTGLVVKTDTTGDGSWLTTWDTTDYQLEPLNAEVIHASDTADPYAWWRIVAIDEKTFPVHRFRTTLQVTARYGWTDIPDDIKLACLLHATNLFKRKDAPFGVAAFGDFGPIRVSRLDPDVRALLMPYRRMTIGPI